MAPTTLEVPDPDEVSGEEEIKEESGKGMEMQGKAVHGICSDLNASRDFFSGIVKIVPSDVDKKSCYLLQSCKGQHTFRFTLYFFNLPFSDLMCTRDVLEIISYFNCPHIPVLRCIASIIMRESLLGPNCCCLHSDADYWFLSDDAIVSITEIWNTGQVAPRFLPVAAIEWNGLSTIHKDYDRASNLHEDCNITTDNAPPLQTTPPNTSELPPSCKSS